MTRLERFTLTVVLVLIFGFVNISIAASSQYRQISLYGMVSHTSKEKTVTWADGTSEKITVDDKGKIYLDGVPKIAFGFHIATAMMVGEPTDSTRANKILDWLQQRKVRFMSLYFMGSITDAWMVTWINFWMPKLYVHKMFTMLTCDEQPPGTLNVANQYRRLSIVIDAITDQRYADTIFSLSYSEEIDNFGHTDTEVNTYLSQLYPQVKTKVQTSLIGNVSLVAENCVTQSTTGTTPIVKWSDIPNWDLAVSEPWQSYIDVRVAAYHSTTMVQAGKTGYQIWFGGSQHANGNNYYTPEIFQYLLDSAGYKDVSLLFLWCLEWDYANYKFAWFDSNGDPSATLLDLVPYFP